MTKENLLRSSALVLSISFFMSATDCEQKEGRSLKRNVKVIDLHASNFLDSAGFNFSEVAKSQFSGVLFEKNHFFERNVYPKAVDIAIPHDLSNLKKASVDNIQVMSAEELQASQMGVQIKKWFPQAKAANLDFSTDSSCLISRPQHFIAGKINSLEAYSGASLQFGFNQSIVQVPVSAKFKMDKMRMDLSFHAFNPWTQEKSASVNAESFKKDYSAGFGIDLGIIHIGPEFYRVTGMAEVTLQGLRNSVEALAKKLTELPGEEWSTRVIYGGDNSIVIMGGAELGLKKGDQFKVYNQIHTWNGEPCGDSSVLTGSTIVSDTQDPWIIEIEDAGTLMSKGRVLNQKDESAINLGAIVKKHMFVEEVEALKAQQASQKPK